MRAFLLWLCTSTFLLVGGGLAYAQAPAKPAIVGAKIGHYNGSVGLAAWTNTTNSSYAVVGPEPILLTDRVVELIVVNTDATGHLYVLLTTGVAQATTAAIEVRAGSALTLDVWGMNVSTIAYLGNEAVTTFRATTTWAGGHQ